MIASASTTAASNIFALRLSDEWKFSAEIAGLPLLITVLAFGVAMLLFRYWTARKLPNFEIDAAELGFGDHKVSFKPNELDRQIAYSIWVELSTRKIGLPIDLEDDVIAEIYDSWYAFFAVTRGLIKDIPVRKVRGDSTGKIISLSIEVLNEGLRPHLTKWQARFRHWYDKQLASKGDFSPQELQKNFPAFEELGTDILAVNQRLRSYRQRMYALATGQEGTSKI